MQRAVSSSPGLSQFPHLSFICCSTVVSAVRVSHARRGRGALHSAGPCRQPCRAREKPPRQAGGGVGGVAVICTILSRFERGAGAENADISRQTLGIGLLSELSALIAAPVRERAGNRGHWGHGAQSTLRGGGTAPLQWGPGDGGVTGSLSHRPPLGTGSLGARRSCWDLQPLPMLWWHWGAPGKVWGCRAQPEPGAAGRWARAQPCGGCRCREKQVGQLLPGASRLGGAVWKQSRVQHSRARGFPSPPGGLVWGRGTVAIWQPAPPAPVPTAASPGPGWGKWVSGGAPPWRQPPGACPFPSSAWLFACSPLGLQQPQGSASGAWVSLQHPTNQPHQPLLLRCRFMCFHPISTAVSHHTRPRACPGAAAPQEKLNKAKQC